MFELQFPKSPPITSQMPGATQDNEQRGSFISQSVERSNSISIPSDGSIPEGAPHYHHPPSGGSGNE
jgi:hypothetical protein